MTLIELAERVEILATGWRDMDADIHEATGHDVDRRCPIEWHSDDETPRYTFSLDAALRLVPDPAMCDGGWRVEYHYDLRRGCHASVWLHADAEPGDGWFVGNAATPALALCAAALRAQGIEAGTGETAKAARPRSGESPVPVGDASKGGIHDSI